MSTTVRPELRELSLVVATAALHVLWNRMQWPRPVLVVPMVGAWIGFLAVTAVRDPSALARWGLKRDGLLRATGAVLLATAPGVVAMVGMGLVLGRHCPATVLVALLWYPLFGLVQQILLQGMFAGPLAERVGVGPATAVAATLFGALHWPDPPLVVATFLLALVLVPIFVRHRNLWPIAVAHGWLGTLLSYAVLGRDPVRSMFLGG